LTRDRGKKTDRESSGSPQAMQKGTSRSEKILKNFRSQNSQEERERKTLPTSKGKKQRLLGLIVTQFTRLLKSEQTSKKAQEIQVHLVRNRAI